MSAALLTRLQAEHAFDPAPRRADLGAYHVPFSRLGSPRDLEQTLLRAVRHTERVAIVGRSGCGKSSLLAHVLGPTAEHVAPILVRVAPEPADVVASVQSMAAHITQTLVANGLAEEFFARVLTELRELSCALVVAVHES